MMKKCFAAAAVLLAVFLISCRPGLFEHISPAPVTCIPGPIPYATYGANYFGTGSTGVTVINSQAEFDEAYHGFSPPGMPTPVPVPIDFSKKSILSVYVYASCAENVKITGITSDCKTITVQLESTSSCSPVTCFAYSISYYYFLVDKTNLPAVEVREYKECMDPGGFRFQAP